jgi:hypothetical protein
MFYPSGYYIPPLVFFLFFLFTLYMFRMNRLAVAGAVVATSGVLFLPQGAGMDMPMIPPLTKLNLPYLYMLVAVLISARQQLVAARPGRRDDILVILLILGGFVTAYTNLDPLPFGFRAGYRLEPYDGVSMGIRNALDYGLPFLLGRALFRNPRDLKILLLVLAGFMLVYSLLILVELRMAPQFHKWIYGYRAASFRHVSRWGGWRPVVLMHSGLALALLTVAVIEATVALRNAKIRIFGIASGWIAVYLFGVLVFCKSTAAIVYAVLFVPFAVFATPRRVVRIAAIVSSIVMLYPMLRIAGFFPSEALVSYANIVSVERAESLEFRFDNEDILLDHAMERPIFGWGAGGRNFVYDPDSGRSISVTDGAWIIWLGQGGLTRWLACFGMLVWPVFSAARNLPRIRSAQDRAMLAGLALMVSTFALDLLPNGMFTNYSIFLAGALLQLSRSIAAPPRALRHETGDSASIAMQGTRSGEAEEIEPASGGGDRGDAGHSSQASISRPRNLASALLGDSKRRRSRSRTSGSNGEI